MFRPKPISSTEARKKFTKGENVRSRDACVAKTKTTETRKTKIPSTSSPKLQTSKKETLLQNGKNYK